ncbi:MAG: NAD-dependent malic enzyme [Verrucomicrobiales bacterium]|nr:NAD-dependent malic enzyme [Verrucomicrobiales bacterium]
MDTSHLRPSASYSFVVRLSYPNRIGMFARLTQAIGQLGGDLGAVDIVSPDAKRMVRDITVKARDQEHVRSIVDALQKIRDVTVVHVSDQVFLLHLGGKIAVQNKVPVTTRETLSMAYTPGVARVCEAIAEQHGKAWQLTIKGNSVAVISDGSAVLGLGNIGPEAAMPVMEGKAMLFKEFAGIDAYPICLSTQDPKAIIETVANLAVGFGGINLEDISAPRCFEIEQTLQERLDIPVFHDDQHGTAVVVLAALLNASRLARRKLAGLRVVIVGAGAAGTAIANMLQSAGVKDVIVCDRHGILNARTRSDLNEAKQRLAAATNPRGLSGNVETALKGANVVVGVSGPGLIEAKWLRRMAAKPMVFALANPIPEIMPEDAVAAKAWIVATGRSDYPNQINNVLAFPGIFRGALNVRARRINDAMKLAAAQAIAACIAPRQLCPEYIVPSVFNREVVRRVATAVEQAALRTKVARKRPGTK